MSEEKMNISFKVDSRLYMQFKAALATYNAMHGTRYNVSNALLSYIRNTVETGKPYIFQEEEI